MLKITHLIWLMALVLTACSGKKGEWRSMDGAVWGTTYHISYEGDRDLSAEVLTAMQTIDNELSVFNKQSTVSRINAGATDSVSAAFKAVFECSQAVNRLSHGAFDPTVSPLIDLWGFGTKGHEPVQPDSAAIAEALCSVGIDRCRVNADNTLAYTLARRPQFNFSAIAKGYGVDCVAQALSHAGCSNFMVEIGGEVYASGRNPRGEAWHVQIDAPVEGNGHTRMRVIKLLDRAVATSGNYRNYRVLSDGTHVGHTISPRTGMPVATNLLSATVEAPDCMTADALATACMAMCADSASAMIRRVPNVKAYLVTTQNKVIEISGPNNPPANSVQTKD